MDTYDPGTVFSSIDTHGRYAYKNQPKIGAWNLRRLAESLQPLLTPAQADNAIAHYWERYHAHWLSGMHAKLNLPRESPCYEKTINGLLAEMEREGRDFNYPVVIPRNYIVEEALAAAAEMDLAPLHSLLAALRTPYEYNARYAQPPTCGCGYRTFCGT
jgi:uncharacterized protein YdiU (UPF0061 family)